ncbi:MAG TPA: pyrimidine reductase family protein [Acidimicrobiales bacterium]
MRALLPIAAANVDITDAYAVGRSQVPGRAFVRCNMISSLDGAISLNGRSGTLGGPADRMVFQVLRSLADVILVGAGTMRTEGYGPAVLNEDLRNQRKERGQPAVPPIAVVTRSGNLDWSSPFFTEAEQRPIVVTTTGTNPGARERAGHAAELVLAGEDNVDLEEAIANLYGSGYRSVLLEGGPGLNADVVNAGLLDELCVTLSPRIVAGDGPRILAGPELSVPLELDPVHLLEQDGFYFYRFAVRR